MDIEIGKDAVADLLRLLDKPAKAGSPPVQESADTEAVDGPFEIDESISTHRVQGTVQLRGFDPDVVDSISTNLRFRLQAANLGNRVRLIIDIQK